MAQTRREQLQQRKAALIQERSAYLRDWRNISEYQQPRLGRFFTTETKKNVNPQRVLDNTAIFASGVLASGLMSGMTSPARPWFKLSLPDKDLMEFGPVKSWLHRTTQLMRDVFTHSNTYRALHSMYEELGLFGTAASVMLPDFDSVVHHYPMTIGEYAIGTDYKGKVDTFVRDFQMTVGQMVARFGKENCSATVQNMHTSGRLDQWVTVTHLVEPRRERDTTKRDNKNMPFMSLYLEQGMERDDKFLSESGFKRFPVLAPRWAVRGSDVYGTSPGMTAQGDVQALQHAHLRKAQAIDYQTNPPLQVPTAYKDAAQNRLPGGVMFVDANSPGGGVRSAFEVNLNLQHLLADIQDIRERIRQAYFADLFQMLANDTRSGITATEIAERHEEKLLMLGPVLERLHNELLQQMIDNVFEECVDAGILPPIPQELEGVDLNVEFVSTLAQAQRAISGQSMDRLIGTITNLSAVRPEVLDKVDFDQVVDDYADLYGVNPEIILDDTVVAKIRADRAQAQQAAQQAAAVPQMVDTAKTASETDPEGLANVMSALTGYTSAAAG